MRRGQDGFTLIELLVVMGMLSLITVGFYQVMFSGARGADVTDDVVTISEEARLGLNRMVRDAREAEILVAASGTQYVIEGDYDRDGSIEPTPPPGGHPGEAERLAFVFDPAARTITLNGEVLIEGVERIGSEPVFTYMSNNLRYDSDGDGVTAPAEINAPPIGNANNLLDLAAERSLVTSVVYTFAVRADDRLSEFHAEAQMRNRRQ